MGLHYNGYKARDIPVAQDQHRTVDLKWEKLVQQLAQFDEQSHQDLDYWSALSASQARHVPKILQPANKINYQDIFQLYIIFEDTDVTCKEGKVIRYEIKERKGKKYTPGGYQISTHNKINLASNRSCCCHQGISFSYLKSATLILLLVLRPYC